MNTTNTTLTIKTSKKIRDDAKKVASRMGLPLTTIINSMLMQFIRDQTVTISAYPRPLQSKIDEWDRISDEMDKHPERSLKFNDVEGLITHLGLEK